MQQGWPHFLEVFALKQQGLHADLCVLEALFCDQCGVLVDVISVGQEVNDPLSGHFHLGDLFGLVFLHVQLEDNVDQFLSVARFENANFVIMLHYKIALIIRPNQSTL